MNIGYVFDLTGSVSKADLQIPYVSGLHLCDLHNSINIKDIITFRDDVYGNYYSNESINKHILFFIVNNKSELLKTLSDCVANIQDDDTNFNQTDYDIHIICCFKSMNDVSESNFENVVTCQKSNKVCVFSWFVDEYDFRGNKIEETRIKHAVVRMMSMVCNNRNLLPIRHMDKHGNPIYNLFGDFSICYDDNELTASANEYYKYINIQHLLNLSDNSIKEYYDENVKPNIKDNKALEDKISSTSDNFLFKNRVKIESSTITEKTQNILLKTSDNDEDYLINSVDNSIVFLEELSKKQRWQLENTDGYLKEYYNAVDHDNDGAGQLTINQQFIDSLYKTYKIHKRVKLNEINNEISKNRKIQIEPFKVKIDKYLLNYLNKQDNTNYSSLNVNLLDQDVQHHCSNIDLGIAFLDYLADGHVDYLVDQEVSVGDVCIDSIRRAIEEQKRLRLLEYNESEKEINERIFCSNSDEEPSPVRKKLDSCDENIEKNKQTIMECDNELTKWFIIKDNKKKWSARLTSYVTIGFFALFAVLFLFITWKFIGFSFWRLLWSVFIAGMGVGIGMYISKRIERKKDAAFKAIKQAKEKKKTIMLQCVNDVKKIIEKRYKFLMSFHGLKTINELYEYVIWKKKDLEDFRKAIFKLLLDYYAKTLSKLGKGSDDTNTIMLKDTDVISAIFGNNHEKDVAYCFAGEGAKLLNAFEKYRRNKVLFETERFDIVDNTPYDFNKDEIAEEIIEPIKDHSQKGIVYTELNEQSILPSSTSDVEIEDINQGACGDCYFMATLAAIANTHPEYIIDEKNGMIEELDAEHKFFRVKFYDKNGNRFNVDINNKFWNINNIPYYAGKGKRMYGENTYDPWVMAVEKAWAKVNNNGYDGIVGSATTRRLEYSYAVTGKSAYYCMTANVSDKNVLLEKMHKHFLTNKLPITLYSADSDDNAFRNKDQYIVTNHAYALKAMHENTFDIYNPWNSHSDTEQVLGKHYKNVDIDFIMNNFDVVVFFGIKESEFDSFEQDLSNKKYRYDKLSTELDDILDAKFNQIGLTKHSFDELIINVLDKVYNGTSYLFNKNKLKEVIGLEGVEGTLNLFIEYNTGDKKAYNKLNEYIKTRETKISVISKNDDKHIITIFRLSPQFLSSNFK